MFHDRKAAGRALAQRLGALDPARSVVLALPRGGVPVAQEVCAHSGAPLDLILVRKIGAPGQQELAVGAIADGGEADPVINAQVMELCGLSAAEVRDMAKAEQPELERRRALYLGARPRLELAGKTAIIVDDGLATGATMKAAIRAARARQAVRVVVAVPIGAADTVAEMQAEADEVICLETPSPFWAVGQGYANFDQVSDAEVIEAMTAGAAPQQA